MEIRACKPWLEAEIALVKPTVLVCLGATAAQALLGRGFRVSRQRGVFQPSSGSFRLLATVHPSSLLRGDPHQREAEIARFIADLRVAADALAGSASPSRQFSPAVNAVTRQFPPPSYHRPEPRKEMRHDVLFLRFLWTILRPRAVALMRVRSLGDNRAVDPARITWFSSAFSIGRTPPLGEPAERWRSGIVAVTGRRGASCSHFNWLR